MLRKLLRCASVVITIASAMPLLAACRTAGVTEEDVDRILYSNFKTVIATASQDGYAPYWLGRSFEAGAHVYRGPYTSVIGHEVNGGGVSADYVARDGTSLTLTSYSSAAWEQSPQKRSLPQAASTALVSAGPYDARLHRFALHGRPNLLEVVFEFGDTVVVAATNVDASHPAATPNPNPLVDEATLLSVLADLRPFPQ